MSLTATMLVGYSGIQSNSAAVDTVGDNIANVNTTAFKSQRTLFETMLYQTISAGQGPSGTSGGTLPQQIGLGSQVASIQRDFNQGAIQGTGFPSDLAITGDGFFILAQADGDLLFTRDGSFRLDASQTLVSSGGLPLQVFPADDAGNINLGALSNLVIPLGSASAAVPTTNVEMDGRLDAATAVATTGAVVVSAALVTASGAPASATTALTELVDANGLPLFADGDTLSVAFTKGGLAMPASTFVVGTTGRTLGDFAGFLQDVMGISTDPGAGGVGGVSIADGTVFPAGTLVINSNLGQANAIGLNAGSITNTTGPMTSPLSFVTASEATGGGETTSFNVFDSLGNTAEVRLRVAMESQSTTGTVWRFYAESVSDSDLSPLLGTGTITFDANGQFVGATGTDISLDRAGSGAVSPLTFTIDFSGLTGLASVDGRSELVMASQDGAPEGILTGYGVDGDGVVTGIYSNQLEQVFGQVALATFVNNEGLIAGSENTFVPGVNSGDPVIVAPETSIAGSIVAGALEQSNVEIAREFINLIKASAGISSASRVVRVADDLLKELLLLAR